MIKKHIVPAIAGGVVFLILWGVLGQVILPLIEMPNKIKGLIIILGSVLGGVATNNLLSKRAGKADE